MRLLREVIKKEFLHILRDPRTLLIIFGIPVVQILLFGYVITNEIKDVRIAVFDKSRDNVTVKLINKLTSSGYFIIRGEIYRKEEIDTYFKHGIVKEVVVFEPDFAEKLRRDGEPEMQIICDASDPNTARLLSNYTRAVIHDFVMDINSGTDQIFGVFPTIRMLYNPELKGVFMFVPGVMALLLTLISAMITSISITREKELGTMEMLLVSPFRPFHIVLGKMVPYMIISFINTVIIVVLGNTVFGLPVQGNLLLLLGEGMIFITTALCIGVFISTVTESQLIAMMISLVGLMMPTMLLSGFIFPIKDMPLVLQYLSNIVPAKWFIQIIKNVMLKGTGITFIWKETIILVGMTLFFLGLSIKKFKIRLE